jgi:hypothetical protein
MIEPYVQWQFDRGDAGADDIQQAIDRIVVELSDSASEVSEAARAAGIEPADLGEVIVDVREGRQGAEPILTTILIGIAVKAGSTVVETLWREVIWPRLRRRLGARVLGERQDAPAPAEQG